MTDIVSLLKEKKLTVTPQRVEIINLLGSNRHSNVDELYSLLHSSFPSISLATVYKNINIMLEKSLLSEVQIPTKKNVYEIDKGEHCHVACLECNEILDLELDTKNVLKDAESQTGYTLKSSKIVFTGICSSCKEN